MASWSTLWARPCQPCRSPHRVPWPCSSRPGAQVLAFLISDTHGQKIKKKNTHTRMFFFFFSAKRNIMKDYRHDKKHSWSTQSPHPSEFSNTDFSWNWGQMKHPTFSSNGKPNCCAIFNAALLVANRAAFFKANLLRSDAVHTWLLWGAKHIRIGPSFRMIWNKV